MKYKLFGKSGLRVSEICLGTMTFGKELGWGADYESSLRIFDTYAEAEGNFIDTANRYTDGTSEKYLADFIKNDRDHFVLATKYSLVDRFGDPNYSGNHRKNMMRSVEESLKRLNTDVIDLLWLHAWDFTTPVEEILLGLNELIIPIVGARKANQLEDSLKAIEVEIRTETMKKLDEASAIELGFPHDFLSQKGIDENLFGGIRDKILNHRI